MCIRDREYYDYLKRNNSIKEKIRLPFKAPYVYKNEWVSWKDYIGSSYDAYHLSKYNVRRGQKVKRGDIIGFVGNTGRSIGPHLHYEILKDNKKINPLNFYYGNLSQKEFDAILIQSRQENQSMD